VSSRPNNNLAHSGNPDVSTARDAATDADSITISSTVVPKTSAIVLRNSRDADVVPFS
jgi:hypothetical protein